MEIIKTEIPDVLIFKPKVFPDERGIFMETYSKKFFDEIGIHHDFKQDNISVSKKNVIRGLHSQKSPFEQGKLVRVVNGSVLDVAVDIRKNSPTFGQHVKVILSKENNLIFWIPPGFAHGFLALKDDSTLYYKATEFYNKDSEDAIVWNDPDLNIDWEIKEPIIISEKDKNAKSLKDYIQLI